MTVYKTTADVFFGGRRRWFSLDAACRADAKQIIKQGGDDDSDQEYMASVARLAAAARAEFALLPTQPVPVPELRALAACRELLAARKEVESLTHLIGDALGTCQEAWIKSRDGLEFSCNEYQSHLAQAYASNVTQPASQYEDGEIGYLNESQQLEVLSVCPHCLAAHNAIQERKLARRRLGAARRAITLIGKS